MRIRTKGWFTVVLVCLWCAGNAQVYNSEFKKLFDLYTMEEYAKCAYKAEKYSRKEQYRRDPEPYLYMALCFYQAHVHPEKFEQEFEEPLKDALSYAYKFRKADKKGELYSVNKPLLDKIREEALSTAKFYYNDGEYRKASSEFSKILKVVPDDVNLIFISGVADIMSKNAQGERKINTAMDTLRAQLEGNRFEKDPVTHDVLIKAFVGYTDYLSGNGKQEKAEEVIAFARKLIPDDPTLKTQYKKIYAIIPKEQQ